MSALTSLGINAKLLLAQFVDFAIVLLILWRFVYKPLFKIMDERSKKISEGLANAEEADKRLADVKREAEGLLLRARAEAEERKAAARLLAERERQEIKKQTEVELERQLTEARSRLKQEREQMVKLAKEELADAIVEASAKVTAGKIYETAR